MDIDAAVIAAFRTAYPEFSDNTKWPDDALERALCEGDAETGGCGWGAYDSTDCHNFKARGMYLYAAAWLVTAYPQGATNLDDVVTGGSYATTGKSVGDESINYASPDYSKITPGDEWLSANFYGQQYLRLRKRAGMGALAL